MTGIEFALLYVGWMLADGSPGPATLSIAGTSMEQGRRAGLVFALGILAGGATLGLAAAAGMSGVMLAHGWIFELLRYFGAGYLLFLAFRALRATLQRKSALLTKSHQGTDRQLFLRGLLVHLTNPKAILTWASIYSIVLPAGAGSGDVFGLFGLLFIGSIVIYIGYALLFSNPAIVRGYRRMHRGFNLLFALLFGAASLKLLTVRLV